jgi:saccharopine dehydrogenase (NAD+, L-lysine-forming)
MSKKSIGIIREGKNPPDSRVPFTPTHCQNIIKNFETTIKVESSPARCIKDDQYSKAGFEPTNDISDCDIIFGVKEVPINMLVPNKTHFFFSHTIKAQPYNRKLLLACLEKNIRLIDYEPLTFENGQRVVGFGRWAGIVGAHNGLLTWGRRTGEFDLKAAHDCKDYKELVGQYKSIIHKPLKIAVTGNGRVAKGSIELLKLIGVKEVSAKDYLEKEFDHTVFSQIEIKDYVKHTEYTDFEVAHFFKYPAQYESSFKPYTKVTDLFINAVYWDPSSPVFFTHNDMKQPDFRIKVIADVTCDIKGSIPSTVRPSTIDNPIYGYSKNEEKETEPHQEGVIDVMAVDNLPNELPLDASESFGDVLLENIIPELFKEQSDLLDRATICKNGRLTEKFSYLQDFVDGK